MNTTALTKVMVYVESTINQGFQFVHFDNIIQATKFIENLKKLSNTLNCKIINL